MPSAISRNALTAMLSIVTSLFAASAMAQLTTSTTTQTVTTQAVPDWLSKLPLATPSATVTLEALVPDDFTGTKFQVIATQFDPGHTYLVQSAWLNGIGCPTNATIAVPNPEFTAIDHFSTFTDAACPIGMADPNDSRVQGLLLAKTGPTLTNFAAAVARIVGVKGQPLTELGWDIRKQGAPILTPVSPAASSLLGSHCGAGAPRWNIQTTDAFYFLGCNSPPADIQFASDTGWIRMRWGGPGTAGLMAFNANNNFALEPVTGTVISLSIVFDEGQDELGAPDKFGAAILDNIDINGVMTGTGPVNAK